MKNDATASLAQLGAATLGESGARRMASRIRPVWRGAALCAPAFSIQCAPGDNLGIHVGLTRAPRGSVLVANVGEIPERGYWGEVLTTAALAKGIAGLVIDGCVRDIAALEAGGFPVFSTGVSLPGATKSLPGVTGASVQVGGVSVVTGDWVVGDVDGVVVVPQHILDEVVAAGQARFDKEGEMFRSLNEGATTVELLDLDESLIRDDSES